VKIDFDNKKHSIIYGALLMAFIASIITVIILGLRGSEMLFFNKIESLYIGRNMEDLTQKDHKMIFPNGYSREHKFVPGAERALGIRHDVAPGWVKVDYNIPYELPICLTEDYIDQYFDLSVISYGGYTPDDLGINYLVAYQPKTGKGGLIDITWSEGTLMNPSSTMEYSASFDIVGADSILLDSNHLPNVINEDPNYTFFVEEVEPTPNLCKWVDIGVFSSWKGCPDQNQKFKLILAHYHCVPRIPQSQTKI
jgi:hypothetical protein